MRRGTLLTQVLLVNLLLIAAAVVAAAIASDPQRQISEGEALGLILGFALALTIAVNVFLLARRFAPLEDLADEMERVSLSPGAAAEESEPAPGPEEVRRLHESFRRMLVRLEQERRHAASAALEAQERERARVALDLHDEVNQALTGVLLRIEALRAKAPPELSAELAETKEVAGAAMEELLALARRLRPTALDDLGLEAAIGGLVDEIRRGGGIDVTLEREGELDGLPDRVSLVAYRIAQEALSNSLRHAGAGRIRVLLRNGAGGLELRVSDDGGGFDPERAGDGLGIAGMRERALLAGGRLAIDSGPGIGTRIRLTVPRADEGRAR